MNELAQRIIQRATGARLRQLCAEHHIHYVPGAYLAYLENEPPPDVQAELDDLLPPDVLKIYVCFSPEEWNEP